MDGGTLDGAMTSVSVRRAVPEDAEIAVAVVRESITKLCVADHQNDPATLESWLGNKTTDSFVRWIASPDEHLVVAELDSVIGGVASLHTSGEIRLCYVAPGRQRAGMGRALLGALEAVARARGLQKVVLKSTVGARAFYESNGYVPSGDPVSGCGRVRCFPYEKTISSRRDSDG
jgi:GNAT superfamily N-acetyltransferase